MSKIVLALLFLFLVYEVILKDNFGIRKVVRNHFESLERGIYSILVTLVFPIALLIVFRESHVYTVRNLENLLIVLSIFVSVLFGIMGDISSKDTENIELKDMTLSSAIFIIIECLISMILTFGLMTSYTIDSDLDVVFKILNSINFYLVFSILINTMVILKRFSKLIRE